MRCSSCGSENPQPQKFCGECGKPFVAREDVRVEGKSGAYYCARHRKVETRVLCGRCEKPVCPSCAVYGPVGVRCRDCAKSRVPVRPMGVIHGAGRELERRPVWYLAIWIFLVAIVTNLFGGDDT